MNKCEYIIEIDEEFNIWSNNKIVGSLDVDEGIVFKKYLGEDIRDIYSEIENTETEWMPNQIVLELIKEKCTIDDIIKLKKASVI